MFTRKVMKALGLGIPEFKFWTIEPHQEVSSLLNLFSEFVVNAQTY